MKKLLLTSALLLCGQWLLAQDCTPASLPYVQDFESATAPALPDCTLAANGGTGNNWVVANNPGSGFENNALSYTGTTEAANAWFFTQGLALTAGLSYKITYTYGNNNTDTTEKLKIWLGSSAAATGMTTTLVTYDNVTGAAQTTATTGPFTVSETGTFYIGFNAYSEASQGSLYVDNITVDNFTCDLPANLAVTGITTTAATLQWDAVTTGDAVQFYQISVQPGTAAAEVGPTTVTTTAPTFFDLTPATTYTAYVRSFCSGVWSDWTEGETFVTPACNTTATVPYVQDFESVTAPAIPECNVATAGETGGNWTTAVAPGSGFTTNALSYTATDGAADAWFFTQGVQLEAGSYYKISYKYGNNGDTTESLTSYLASGPGEAAVLNPFGTHTGITGGTAVNYMFPNPISVAESGIYYLGFHIDSAASQGSLYIDDISITPWTCDDPTAITVSSITETSATISWTAPEGSLPMGYFYAVSLTDTMPTDFLMSPTTSVTLEDLLPGTDYYFFVQSFCGPVTGEWTTPVPFTTAVAGAVAGHDFNSLQVYPNPAKTIVSISSKTLIDSATLYNITGQEILSQNIAAVSTDINIEKLPAGIYLLSLYSNSATKTIKIVKE